jgi:putative transposase
MKNGAAKGTAATVAAATIYGFTGVFIRFLTDLGLNVYSINFLELLIGLPLILLVARVGRERVQRPTGQECLWLSLIGLCYFATTMALFYAYNYTTIANVEFLHYMSPLLTAAGAALLLKETLNRGKLIALVLSAVGLALILNPDLALDNQMQLGNLLAFASALSVAATTLLGRKLRDRSAYFTAFWSTLAAAIVYAPLFFTHNSISGLEHFPPNLEALATQGLKQIGSIALVSLLFIGVAAPLYYSGLRYLEASKAGVVLLTEVVVAVIVAAVFYKEIPSALNIFGGLLILASGIIILKEESPRRERMTQVRRTAHALYQIHYHFVWVPKRRRDVLVDRVAAKVQDVLAEIAEQYELEIGEIDVQESYVHVELSAPPKYAPEEIVRWLKEISARETFAAFPEVRQELWAGELWADGYYVSTSGNGLSPQVIAQYAQYQPYQRLLEPLAQRG